MNASDGRRPTAPKSSIPSAAADGVEMLDLGPTGTTSAVAPDTGVVRDIPEGLLALQSYVSGGSDPVLCGEYVSRDRCWLCQCSRTSSNCDSDNSSEESCKSKVGVLSEFLPWLCSDCENTMEEEEKKVELSHLTSVSFDTSDSEDSVCNAEVCHCDSCREIRQTEREHEKESKELQDCWIELSQNVRKVYNMHKEDDQIPDKVDVEKMKQLVTRLSAHDAHQLYQRLESQGREVVIEMKVKLLKVLTLDYKTAPGAYQFVSMLLEEYSRLCQSCQTAAVFLQPLVDQHLQQFCLTWQLHSKHLFHCIIVTDPVVQNCLPKALENIRQGLSINSSECQASYSQTLAEYEKFVNEMSVISTTWKHCQRLIEKYDEKQASLKVRQKMFKEDWEFFKAQRRLLEQMVPKSKSSSLSCHRFEMQFQQMQKILSSNRDQEYECPNCRQVWCSLNENSISHLITCGIISPEVVKESSTSEPHSAYLNIKPPSIPSSGSSSCSGSPVILERERFIVPFDSLCGSDEELAEESVSDDDDDDEDYHECELAPPDCGSGQSLASERRNETGLNQSDLCCLATDADDVDELEKTELKETRPSSSAVKLAFTQVRSDGDPCSCHHCKLQNNTLCMFSRARFHEPTQRHNILLSNLFSLDVCDLPVRVEDSEDDGKTKENELTKPDMSLAASVQNSSASSCSSSCKADLTDPVHCSEVNSLLRSSCQEPRQLDLDNAINLASSLSCFNSDFILGCFEEAKGLSRLEEWKPDACTDHWSCSRLKKNFLLKMPEKQSVDSEILEEANAMLTNEVSAASKSLDLSSGTKCSAAPPSVSCQQHSSTSPVQPTSLHSKPSSGQNSSIGSSCQISADRKSTHATHVNGGSSDILKSTCARQNQQKQGTNTAGSHCRDADQNGGCLIHGCERIGEETGENKEDGCDRNAASQKDGKHCECWHCEFFGRETPSSIPLSKNYPEMRERLRLQLKKKKEKERVSQKIDSDSPQKPSELCNMGVEELIRFINGSCEGNEIGKESRSSSRSASKKSKRQKKLKDNMQDVDASSNMQSSSETSSSLGSLADSGFNSREGMNSKHALEHDRLSADMERLRFRLTSGRQLVDSKGPDEASTRAKSNVSEVLNKSVLGVEKEVAAKVIHAQNASLERLCQTAPESLSSEALNIRSSSSLPHDSEVLKKSEILSTETAIADCKNSCAVEIKKYSKDSKSAFNAGMSSSNSRPETVQESSKKKPLSKPASLSVCASHKATLQSHMKTTTAASTMSPLTKAKKQKRRNRADGVVSAGDVFLPKENNKDQKVKEFKRMVDQEVEEFKRFCFSTPPLQKREKLLFPLNLNYIFNQKKFSQGCTS